MSQKASRTPEPRLRLQERHLKVLDLARLQVPDQTITNGCPYDQRQSHQEVLQTQCLRGPRLLHRFSSKFKHRKTAFLHCDMVHRSNLRTEVDQTLVLQASTMLHPSRHLSNTSNSRNRLCALLNKLSNSNHLIDPSQPGSRVTRISSNSSKRSNHNNRHSLRHKPLHLVPRLDRGKGLANLSRTRKSSAN